MQEFNGHTCEAVLRTCKTCFVYTHSTCNATSVYFRVAKGCSQNSPKILRRVINYILHQIFHPTNLFSPSNTGILEKITESS